MYTDEKDIAQKAEQMVTTAMRQKVGSLGFAHHKSDSGMQSIGLSGAIARTKIGRANLEGGLRTYMNALVLSMPIHGFVQHYGDKGTRTGGTRERTSPRFNRYTFRTHEWDLPAKDFIDKAIDQSGVVPFVLENITRIRGEGVVFYLKNFFADVKDSKIG